MSSPVIARLLIGTGAMPGMFESCSVSPVSVPSVVATASTVAAQSNPGKVEVWQSS